MIAVFSQLEYPSLSRETATTSACLVTTQYPSSSKPETPRRCGFHQTGAARRSSASSSSGTRWVYRSGSVKSKPGGMLGCLVLRCAVLGSATAAPPSASTVSRWHNCNVF